MTVRIKFRRLRVRFYFIFLVIYLCCCFWISCESPTAPRPEEQHPIIGSWNWIESWIGGVLFTPESVGFTINYTFDSDSMLWIFEDSTLVDSTYYKILREYAPTIGDTVDVVYTVSMRGGLLPEWTAEIFSHDTLLLTGVGLDAGRGKYRRVK